MVGFVLFGIFLMLILAVATMDQFELKNVIYAWCS